MNYQQELNNLYPNHRLIESISKDLQNQHHYVETLTKNDYEQLYNNNQDLCNKSHDICFKSHQDKLDFLTQIYTEKKVESETLTYELLHFKGEVKDNVYLTINKFNLLIEDYIEDQFFREHNESNQYFTVKKNTTLYVNSISRKNKHNTYLKTHLKMLEAYLNRNFDSKFKYYIIDDDKYDFSWVFIKQY